MNFHRNKFRGIGLLFLVALLAGCATQKKDTGPKYTFFPPAPDAPRLQFLTSFSSESEFRNKSGRTLLTFITGQEPQVRQIVKPYGAAVQGGNLYVCDTGFGSILKFDLVNRRFSTVAPTGPAALKLPLNLAVDSDGMLYIADSLRQQVVIVDKDGNLVATIGEKGVNGPRDVALTADRIYVGDVDQHCVHVYNKASRQLLFDIPRPESATNIAERLFQPSNLAMDSQGRLYVSDVGAYRVQVFDHDGNYVRTIGRYGDNWGEFARNKGIAVDRENRLYAVDAAAQAVQIFNEEGRLLMWFGDPSASKVGLMLPAKVVVDYDNVGLFERYAAPDFQVEYLVIVINQYGPRKVSVFGFGHKK